MLYGCVLIQYLPMYIFWEAYASVNGMQTLFS